MARRPPGAYWEDVLRTELEFNRRAGLTAADYRIPEYMLQ